MDPVIYVAEDGLRKSARLATRMTTVDAPLQSAFSVDECVTGGALPISPISMVSTPASASSPSADSSSSNGVSLDTMDQIIISSELKEDISLAESEKKRKAEEAPLTDLITPNRPSQGDRPSKIVVLSISRKVASSENFLRAISQSSPSKSDTELYILPFTEARKRKPAIFKYNKYHQSAQHDKPEPCGQPPVWAEKRQSLCETLPYYKAYMSGVYQHEGVVRGFLVDKEVGPRDKFQEEILITSVGGGRTLDDESGRMVQKADQHTSSFALAFQRAKDKKQPIAIIAGQGNRISPSKLPHYYNVLDWFHVTDVWCERNRGFKIWMVRVEKIRLGEKSWWAPLDSAPLDPARDIDTTKTRVAKCNLCNHESKEIYNAGWTCLEPSCHAFFKFAADIDDSEIDYCEEYLKERTRFVGSGLNPLAPPLLNTADLETGRCFGVERVFKDGIVCPLCRGCSRRIEWDHWSCETQSCTFTRYFRQKTISVHDAISESILTKEEGFASDPEIRVGQKTMGLYDVVEYVMPSMEKGEVVGIIRHFRSKGLINSQPDGPNDLFRQMQEKDFGLKRNPARQKGSTCEILTSHWAANWGAPYKYGVSVLSKGFDEAPEVIIKALKRLTWAGEQTVTEKLDPFCPFNELLSLGYFEDTSIGYHDDGEKELGPTVATLSLGASAVMYLRPKARGGHGSKSAKGTKRDVLKIILRHGDMHAVYPQGKLRFALTCRYVRPELMANDEERQQTIIKSKLPDGHERFNYNGDVDAKPQTSRDSEESEAAAQKLMKDITGHVMAGNISSDAVVSWASKLIGNTAGCCDGLISS